MCPCSEQQLPADMRMAQPLAETRDQRLPTAWGSFTASSLIKGHMNKGFMSLGNGALGELVPMNDNLIAVSKMIRIGVLEHRIPTSAISINNAIQKQGLQLPFSRKAFAVAALLHSIRRAAAVIETLSCNMTLLIDGKAR